MADLPFAQRLLLRLASDGEPRPRRTVRLLAGLADKAPGSEQPQTRCAGCSGLLSGPEGGGVCIILYFSNLICL